MAGGVYLEPRFKLLDLLPRRRTTSKDSDFRRRRNDGSLAERGPVRVSTVVLHRPNPVAREMPGFIGFFARRVWLAEREGEGPQNPVRSDIRELRGSNIPR